MAFAESYKKVSDLRMTNMKSTKQKTWRAAVTVAVAAAAARFYFAPGAGLQPATLESCINDVCAGRASCVRFGDDGMSDWVQPFNLGQTSVPVAVVRPKNAGEVAGVVKCALKHDTKVQAKAGGHSFANHGLGGENGAITIDMHHFQYTSVNMLNPSRSIRVGGGTRLGQIEEHLGPYKRAMPRGVCGDIGIGGHATVGGIGPMSRMWGTTLDHVEGVEVVTSNGTLVRANKKENPDLFFAIRGAGASFGIVTEFTMKTHPAPKEVLHYTHDFQSSSLEEKVDAFHQWQTLIADSTLDQRLGTEFTLTSGGGASISATWYGSEDDLQQSEILGKLPSGAAPALLSHETWESSLMKHGIQEARHKSTSPSKFFSKGLGFTKADLFSKAAISALFERATAQDQESGPWSIKFQAAGGAISDVPTSATAFAHRDKVMFYQSFAPSGCAATEGVLEGFHREILNGMATRTPGAYPGFADSELRDAQAAYWQGNLPVLEDIKASWDPMDVFHNPQSVRPRAS
ncbi:berberine bridge enzyme [Colletotrichum karsti]|uniref:Berberine bridge enzyme n=1 Tax=Colletotrichum karsti TaxID=1095194 RepID=A0A9P6HV35_9PEZI|nr:berberine bridge enzyme [Colletotrichum karsti]KAF9870979.1 berberine bridge enzyme [Colletotrichum karsti]